MSNDNITSKTPQSAMSLDEMMVAVLNATKSEDYWRVQELRGIFDTWKLCEDTESAFNQMFDICDELLILKERIVKHNIRWDMYH